MEDQYDTTLAATMLSAPRQAIRLARQSGYTAGRTPVAGRFVQQSHALSTPIASPRSLVIAAAIAFALYLLGRRLSD